MTALAADGIVLAAATAFVGAMVVALRQRSAARAATLALAHAHLRHAGFNAAALRVAAAARDSVETVRSEIGRARDHAEVGARPAAR